MESSPKHQEAPLFPFTIFNWPFITLLTLVWTRTKFRFARDGWFLMIIVNYLPFCKNLESSTLADNISQATTQLWVNKRRRWWWWWWCPQQEEVVMVVVMMMSSTRGGGGGGDDGGGLSCTSSSHVLRGGPNWTSTHQCTIKDGWYVISKQFSVGFQFPS